MSPSAHTSPPQTESSHSKLHAMNLHGDINRAKQAFAPDRRIPSLAEIKRVIPPHCFTPNLAISIFYVLRDFLFVLTLYYGAYLTYGTAYHLPYLPFFWFFTGFFMWAIFVLGHDCGHGSFSRYKSVNSFFGHILHSFVLVPFHSWRISHRKHHKNTANYEKDEIFYPIPHSEYDGIPPIARLIYKQLCFLGPCAYPIYLIKGYGNAMKNASHFSIRSELFTKDERPLIILSLSCWSVMASFLLACTCHFGLLSVMTYYGIPFLIFCCWLLVVTFLHHTQPGSAWYNTRSWNYVRGNLESIDRVYGWLEHFHHDIGTHVVHHLFPAIPHYYLLDANAAVRPFLGPLHKIANTHPLQQLPLSLHAWQASHVIPDSTDLFVIPQPNP